MNNRMYATSKPAKRVIFGNIAEEEEFKNDIDIPLNEESVLDTVAVSPLLNNKNNWILAIYSLYPYRDLPPIENNWTEATVQDEISEEQMKDKGIFPRAQPKSDSDVPMMKGEHDILAFEEDESEHDLLAFPDNYNDW